MKLAFGELYDSARVAVLKANDVLRYETYVGVSGRLVEDGRVIVTLTNSAVDSAAVRRRAIRSLELAYLLPGREPDLQFVPRLFGEVSEGSITSPPERPSAVVAHFEISVNDDHLSMFVGLHHYLPQCAQSSATGTGDN